MYSLAISAQLSNLAVIRRFVKEAATALEVEPSLIPKLQLAVDEAATNIILHGYRNQDGNLEIELEHAGPDLVIRLRDEAAPFDPTLLPAPDVTLPLAERSPGGLGVYLIRRTMDEVLHRLTASGGNELTLIKRGVCGT